MGRIFHRKKKPGAVTNKRVLFECTLKQAFGEIQKPSFFKISFTKSIQTTLIIDHNGVDYRSHT